MKIDTYPDELEISLDDRTWLNLVVFKGRLSVGVHTPVESEFAAGEFTMPVEDTPDALMAIQNWIEGLDKAAQTD